MGAPFSKGEKWESAHFQRGKRHAAACRYRVAQASLPVEVFWAIGGTRHGAPWR